MRAAASSESIASAIDLVGQLDLILSRSSLQAKFSQTPDMQDRKWQDIKDKGHMDCKVFLIKRPWY